MSATREERPAVSVVYLNGEFTRAEDALISPEDRGFNFADGLYEVIRVYNGVPFCMKEHLERLQFGGEELDLQIPLSQQEIEDIVHRLLEDNDISGGMVYLQVTRGMARRLHPFPDEYEPTVYMFAREASAPPRQTLEQGVKAITHPDNRGGLCYIKTIALLANCLAQTRARRAGAFEAILVRDGFVTEATARSVFAVIDDVMYTYPLANILPSITRHNVLKLAREKDWPVIERALHLQRFMDADEVFLAGTVAEVVPVVQIDGERIGTGEPGPVFRRVHRAFQDLIKAACGG